MRAGGAQRGGIDPGLVVRVAGSVEVGLEPRAVAALVRFGELFLEWNGKINLASLHAPEELVDRHFVDAFAGSSFLAGARVVADIGTGGGLPGVPLAVLNPTVQFHLYEPNRKKAAFLRTAARELGMTDRVEVRTVGVSVPVDPALRSYYDVALSRATMPPVSWLPLGQELIQVAGKVLVFATVHSVRGLPAPLHSREYGENRRLLVYPSAVGLGPRT
jgi:16S rRNA (guanine527-N7)-methyltransferase